MTEQAIHMQGNVTYRGNQFTLKKMVKRLFDITVAFFGLLILSPVFLLIGSLIRRDSPGPVFYRGQRLGLGGKVFHILKFRTMYERQESYQGLPITASGDERITPIGRWLRDTKLNELPQLWNVLVGEMSLVGPRPEDPVIGATWPKDVFDEVLSIRPGITSPASVMYRKEESLLQADNVIASYLDTILPSKLRLDQLYVRHHSLWIDLDIIFWTFIVFIPGLSQYNPPEERLLWGPISRLFTRYMDWFVVDVLITFIAMAVTGAIWRTFGPLHIGWGHAVLVAVGYAFLYSLIGVLMGVNRITWSKALASDALDLLPPVMVATLVVVIANASWQPVHLPVALILVAAVLSLMGYVTARYRSRLLTGLSTRWLAWRDGGHHALERALIVGGGESGQFAAWLLSMSHQASLYQVVGFVDDDLYKQGARIRGIKVLGKSSEIPQLVAKYDIGSLFFAIHNISQPERQKLLAICSSTPARVAMIPDFLRMVGSISERMVSAQSGNGKHGSRKNGKGGNGKVHGMPVAQAKGTWDGHRVGEPGTLNLAPLRLEAWLSDLDETAQGGDLEALRSKIRAMQEQIQADRIGQPQAIEA